MRPCRWPGCARHALPEPARPFCARHRRRAPARGYTILPIVAARHRRRMRRDAYGLRKLDHFVIVK